ncbi:MAG: 2-polyprenyl-3-methyl-5-hydroxy-6-metoxy-1,4-benzoquinol methylase [Paracoccaceae bacterium]|jgi:2-polyprenyl-3-methyl-5-hydroxy-6-metoxy-1,4-benzoquinol methylase
MWDDRYSEPGFLFGTDPAAFMVDQQQYLIRGQKALAIADGEGRNSIFMAEKGLIVTAQDGSEVAVDKARGLAAVREARVDFQHADLRDWDWGAGEYDLVVAIFIQFADPAFRDEIFAGMKRCLKPGGVVMLHGYTPKQIDYGTGGPPTAKTMYTEQLLREGFFDMEILRLQAYDREVQEGRGHSGKSALIDLIAKKI